MGSNRMFHEVTHVWNICCGLHNTAACVLTSMEAAIHFKVWIKLCDWHLQVQGSASVGSYDRIVCDYMLWGEDGQLRQSSHPSRLHLWVEVIAGNQDAGHVGDRPSWRSRRTFHERVAAAVFLLLLFLFLFALVCEVSFILIFAAVYLFLMFSWLDEGQIITSNYITWTEDAVSFIFRPSHDALHLPQHHLFHEDENGRDLICKPGEDAFMNLLSTIIRFIYYYCKERRNIKRKKKRWHTAPGVLLNLQVGLCTRTHSSVLSSSSWSRDRRATRVHMWTLTCWCWRWRSATRQLHRSHPGLRTAGWRSGDDLERKRSKVISSSLNKICQIQCSRAKNTTIRSLGSPRNWIVPTALSLRPSDRRQVDLLLSSSPLYTNYFGSTSQSYIWSLQPWWCMLEDVACGGRGGAADFVISPWRTRLLSHMSRSLWNWGGAVWVRTCCH